MELDWLQLDSTVGAKIVSLCDCWARRDVQGVHKEGGFAVTVPLHGSTLHDCDRGTLELLLTARAGKHKHDEMRPARVTLFPMCVHPTIH